MKVAGRSSDGVGRKPAPHLVRAEGELMTVGPSI